MTASTDMRASNGVARLRGGGIACPLPIDDRAVVQMAHGGGGTKTAEIIEGMLLPALTEAAVAATPGQDCRVQAGELSDGAIVQVGDERLAFSTDSFVVSPRFFPGGDIGSLAIHGTVNDLAMCGAVPLTLSLALVLEEGLEMAELQRIVDSIAAASAAVGVPVTTGDTKVVDRGKGDGVYINTTGIGRITAPVDLSPSNCRPGDAILVSGPIGDHGVAIMAARGGLHLDTDVVSDSASVVDLAMAVLTAAPNTRVLRDPTRGGVATVLCELADASSVAFDVDEHHVPVRPGVRAACELLGLDPLYVACEGRFLAIVPPEEADAALAAMQSRADGAAAAVIGEVAQGPAHVVLRTAIGSRRRLTRLSGEQLPRIC